MALTATFVRHRGARDHIYVRRSDGTMCDWAFPTYGDQLPHDLCHLVIEQALKIADGFWGLVEDGMQVELVNDQGTLTRDGRPLAEYVDVDLSGLLQAEEAVALLGPTGMKVEEIGSLAVARATSTGSTAENLSSIRSRLGFALPTDSDASALTEVRDRLRELGERWRNLGDDEPLTVEYLRP